MRSLLFALPAALLFSGCSLLFVQKGGLKTISGSLREIPKAPTLAGETGAAVFHEVRRGESLWSIARRYYGKGSRYPLLARANGLDPEGVLRAGVRLTVPAFPAPGVPVEALGNTEAGLRTVRLRVDGREVEMEVSGAERKARPRENRAFAPGEYLKFVVRYFAVVGGYATLEVRDLVEHGGRPCYRLVGTAKSAFPFSTFYKVDDYLESLFDAVDFMSWRYVKRTREGGYQEDSLLTYDQMAHKAVWYKNQEPPRETAIPPLVQDVLSAFYYFRLLDVKPGESVAIPTNARGKNYELVVDVLKRESVWVRAGKFDCLRLKPHVKYDNVFQNKGEIDLWVTDDARKVPVLIKTKIVVGSIDIELIEARLPRMD